MGDTGTTKIKNINETKKSQEAWKFENLKEEPKNVISKSEMSRKTI